ncbi:hypothetical protein AQS8620_02776 [Aquimixticola soesokkakensis]|uniref:Uncharacterized protein n=1 Tax=Aquimixticola soesokkakensis TaxID=1519096 RepID=A0A1Y5TG26_9RHOB|nr:hypothetical protein [Aquimixticola soesokkakensis]SLN61060.1 hypothetical protein AQS8620_02776 [Aquimixticola soesokkakensis]
MPLIALVLVIVVFVAMYVLRTGRSRDCRWRQVGREGDSLHWRCAACGAQSDTGPTLHGKKERPAEMPTFCALTATKPK